MENKKKTDLSLLKKLVETLELSLQSANCMHDSNEYVVEMSKAAGLAAGVANEATLLITDIMLDSSPLNSLIYK